MEIKQKGLGLEHIRRNRTQLQLYLFLEILNLRGATCFRQVGTGATKDTWLERSTGKEIRWLEVVISWCRLNSLQARTERDSPLCQRQINQQFEFVSQHTVGISTVYSPWYQQKFHMWRKIHTSQGRNPAVNAVNHPSLRWRCIKTTQDTRSRRRWKRSKFSWNEMFQTCSCSVPSYINQLFKTTLTFFFLLFAPTGANEHRKSTTPLTRCRSS